jgi:hypothetical protein
VCGLKRQFDLEETTSLHAHLRVRGTLYVL